MATLTTIAGQFTVQIEVTGGRAFLEVHDENGLRYSEALDNVNKIASRLLAEDARVCPECDNTGIIDDGNNALPCRCKHGDKATFNVSGHGPISGAQRKRERGWYDLRDAAAAPVHARVRGSESESLTRRKQMGQSEGAKTYHILYGAFPVLHQTGMRTFDPFATGRSLPFESAPKWKADREHTNQPRPGTSGLPRGWNMEVRRIHFQCDRDQAHPAVEAFRATMKAALIVGGVRHDVPLVWGGQDIEPIVIPENVSYSFEVTCVDDQPHELPDMISASPSREFRKALEEMQETMVREQARPWSIASFMNCTNETWAHSPEPDATFFWVFVEGPGELLIV